MNHGIMEGITHMREHVKILAFAGSTREGSLNKKLVRLGAEAARGAGAEVTLVDLRDLPMPLYDGDLEEREGIPGNAMTLKTLMKSHQGFLIASPEYNSSVTGVLKNAIDWASREAHDEDPLECFQDKIAALMGASPGRWGGLRSLTHLRAILQNIGTMVLPSPITLPRAFEAFDEEGRLKDESNQERVEKLASRLVDTLRRLQS